MTNNAIANELPVSLDAQRRETVERLQMVGNGDGSHGSLSAICRAVYFPAYGWTRGAREGLRSRLIWLLGGYGDGSDETEPTVADTPEPVTAELRRHAMPDPEGDEDTLVFDAEDFHDLCSAIDSVHASLEREYEKVADAAGECQERMSRKFAEGCAAALEDDDAIAQMGWVRLPTDADGETWHLGDLTEDCQDIKAMALDDRGWCLIGVNPGNPASHKHLRADSPQALADAAEDFERRARNHAYPGRQAFYDALHNLVESCIRLAAEGGAK